MFHVLCLLIQRQHPAASSSSPEYQPRDSHVFLPPLPALPLQNQCSSSTEKGQNRSVIKAVLLWGWEQSHQADNCKRKYQLLSSAFPGKNEDLAVLAFGSLVSDYLFSFLVLHLLPPVGLTKESSCGRNCGSVQLRLPQQIVCHLPHVAILKAQNHNYEFPFIKVGLAQNKQN